MKTYNFDLKGWKASVAVFFLLYGVFDFFYDIYHALGG